MGSSKAVVELPSSRVFEPFSEAALDRLLGKVGVPHIPAELRQRKAREDLCQAIDSAVAWYQTELDTSPAARRRRFEAIKWGRRFQKACSDMWQAGYRLPGDERLPAIFEWLDMISDSFPEWPSRNVPWQKPLEDWRQEVRPGRSLSAAELLAGWHLPKVFAKHFRSRSKFSRGTNDAHGPCIDFVDAVLVELSIPFAKNSIGAAITAVRQSGLSTSEEVTQER
jgi:hypothetical protein